MKVHGHFGIGFPEVVYKRTLLSALRKIGVSCKEEVVEREIV